MIDLEKEREAFESCVNIGPTLYLQSVDSYEGATKFVGENHVIRAVSGWNAWKKCAESKQAEIDSLKAQQRELNDTVQHLKTESSGVHAALREQQRINDDLLDKLLGVDAGEYVVVPKEPSFQMKQAAYKQYDTGLNSITEIYQAMIEAAQENSHE